jgi:hypothetical protein
MVLLEEPNLTTGGGFEKKPIQTMLINNKSTAL